MAIKIAKPITTLIFIFLAIIRSCQTLFIAWVVKLLINFAISKSSGLLNIVLLSTFGLFFFLLFDLLYEKVYSKLILEINMKIKSRAALCLIFNPDVAKDVDTSFLTNDLKQIEINKIASELEIITNIIQLTLALIFALYNSALLTIIFLFASFIPGISQRLFGIPIEKSSEKWEQKNSNYTEIVKETQNISETARLYNSRQNIWNRFRSAAFRMEESLFRLNCLRGFSNETVELLAYAFSMLIPTAVGVLLVKENSVTLGTLMMISTLSNSFVNPSISIFYSLNNIKTTKPMWDKFTKLNVVTSKNNRLPFGKFSGLTLKNVYVELGNHSIINNLSLNIKQGEKVLLMAPSGWGKTTLLKTLLGIIPIKKGKYLLNGNDAEKEKSEIHLYFSCINQQPKLLNDTILYNITLGNKISDHQLKNIVNISGLDTLIQEKGLNYIIGQDGKRLSGGQKQRIEIARALYFDRSIIIADEATSALDNRLSQEIHDALTNIKGKTIIEVAHKISDNEKKQFDRIIELDKLN